MAQALGAATSHNPSPPSPNRPDDVPHHSKQPNSRPPSGLREKILRTPLPYYSGPYSVGMMDIEVPVRDPRHFSEITRNKKHLLELETVLFTVFYPSGFGSGEGRSPEGKKEWSRPTWLPRPRVEVARGYGRFAGLPEWVCAGWFGTWDFHLTCDCFCWRCSSEGCRRALVALIGCPCRSHDGIHQAPCVPQRDFGRTLASGHELPRRWISDQKSSRDPTTRRA
ncbi:hypothetical protein WAI453_011170 [Rhynchosporium graminicola]